MRLGCRRSPLRVLQIDSLHPNRIGTPIYRLDDDHIDDGVLPIDALVSDGLDADSVKLQLLTPVSISSPAKRTQGLDATPVSLARWVKALRLRLSELEPRFAEQFEFQGTAWLTQEHALRDVAVTQAEIRLQNWTYGSRTKTNLINLHGQVGTMRFKGRIAPRVLALLELGQWLGVGQRTTLGHGWYRLT